MARRRLSYWTCRRQKAGVVCLTRNPNRKQKCEGCGKDKPRKSAPKHMAALASTYEDYVALNGGEFCGICGITREQTRNPERRLDRDHFHDTLGLGQARGLLCRGCNMRLRYDLTLEWMRAAVAYLEAHEARSERAA